MTALPRTLLVRTFLLISLLIFVAVAIWITLFALAEREPRARQLAQLTVSVANLTRAALVAAEPAKRLGLLRELVEREGVHLYPAEPDDPVEPLPDRPVFALMRDAVLAQLGPRTRFAGAVFGQPGIWVSFTIDGDSPEDAGDEYWVMLPGEHAARQYPWHWLAWGGASLVLALLVAWLIVSRITQPLRALAAAAAEVGRGRHPAPLDERGSLELQQLAEAFNRMSHDLRRIDAERAEVLAGISHDLRTPLARLRLEAELSIPDAAARDAVSADIEQMDAIIGQFLDYARGDGGEAPRTCDLDTLLAQAAAGLQRGTTTLRLEPGEVPPLALRPQAIARALGNLLENARKYGGGEIEACTRVVDGEAWVEIMDRGPGIPPEQVERLKRPFTRLEGARSNATGTGLGLAIVERIARQHGGRLELLPREGGGLRARLCLPLAAQRDRNI